MNLEDIKETFGGHPVKDLKVEGDLIYGQVSNKYDQNNFKPTKWRISKEGTYADSEFGSEWFDLDLE